MYAIKQFGGWDDFYCELYSDHTTWACNCRRDGLGNPARRWGSDVARGKYALQALSGYKSG